MTRPKTARLPAMGLAALLLLAGASWAALWWLLTLPGVDADRNRLLHLLGPLMSWEWVVWVAIVASIASLACGAWVVILALRHSTRRAVRVLIGAVGTGLWSVAAYFLGLLCFCLLLAAGFAGEWGVLTADDGTRLMVTQDGFDGDVVDFYAHRQGWEWVMRPEDVTVDPREGPCTLVVKDRTTLTVTCGSTSQDVSRP